MHGAIMKSKPYYRCSIARPDYAETDHPRATSIREERIVVARDRWLESLADPEIRAETIEAVLGADSAHSAEPADVRAARQTVINSEVELERLIAGVRAGLDPHLVVAQTKAVQLEKARAEQLLRDWHASHESAMPLTAELIDAALQHAGGVAPLLATADRQTRASLYRNLGIELTYNEEPDGNPRIAVRYQLDGGGGRI